MPQSQVAAAESGLNQGSASWLERGAEALVRYGLVAVIITLPLEFTAQLIGQPLARWALAAVALAFLYLVLARRQGIVLPRRRSALLLIAFVALALASWLLTRAPGSFKEVLDVALYPVAGLLILNVARSEADHRRAWVALLASGLGVAVLGLGLYATHSHIWTPNPVVANRLNITFADPNITARFLTLCACAAVMLFAARQGPSWLSWASAVACAVVVPLTFSRSGLVLFIVAIILAVMISTERRRAATLGTCALVVFAVWTGVNPDTRQRATDAVATLVTTATGTARNISAPPKATTGQAPTDQGMIALDDNRRYLVAAGLKMLIDHPIAGVGYGGYQHQILTGYKRFLPTGVANPDTVSHTAFVTIAAELGILGVLLLLAFLIQLGREALRHRRYVWCAVPATLIVPIILYSQFEGRFFEEPYLWLCLGLFYSASLLDVRGRAVEPAVASARDARPAERNQVA